jgi:hypothetical protein
VPSLSRHDNRLLVVNIDCRLYNIDAETGLDLVPPIVLGTTGTNCWGSPVLGYDGTVYAPAMGLFGVDQVTNAILWSYPLLVDVDVAPVVTDNGDTVLFGDTAGFVHALATADGRMLWQLQIGTVLHSNPALSMDSSIVVIGSDTGEIWALSVSDGSEVWKTQLGSSQVDSNIAIAADGSIYTVSDGYLHHFVFYPIVYFAEGPAVTVREHERRVNLTVRNGDALHAPVAFTVDVVATDNTATGGGVDHSAVPLTTLTFAAGEFDQTVSVPITMDTLYAEGNETLVLSLRNLVQLSGTSTVYIADSSNATTVTILNTPYPYLNSSWPRRGLDNRGSSSRRAAVYSEAGPLNSLGVLQRAAPGRIPAAVGISLVESVAIAADATVVTSSSKGIESFDRMARQWIVSPGGSNFLSHIALLEFVAFLFGFCFLFFVGWFVGWFLLLIIISPTHLTYIYIYIYYILQQR